jgi:LuxR family transcriptional regulator, maltose regulon positive regulatory protein
MITRTIYMRGLLFQHQTKFEYVVRDFKAALERCPEFGHDFFATKVKLDLIWVYHDMGKYTEANALWQEVKIEAEKFGSSLENRVRLVGGLQALTANDLSLADQHFEYVENHENDPIDLARTLLYRAEIARRQNVLTHEHALKLERQFQKIGNSGFLRIDAVKLHLLYCEFVSRGWVVEHFQPHLEPNSSLPAQQVPTLELIVKSFGALQVSINASRVHIPLAKAGELLVWLILNGAATRDEIVRALWGDPNEQRHVEYFKICVRRLRAALTEVVQNLNINPLPFEHHLYSLHERFQIHCDALQLTQAGESNSVEELQAAFDAARGTFLPGSDTEWVLNARMQYHDEALKVSMMLGHLLELVHPKEAVQVYQRVLKLEPLYEEAHLALIRVFQELQETNNAQAVYSRYVQMLKLEFDETPSLELQKVFTPLASISKA